MQVLLPVMQWPATVKASTSILFKNRKLGSCANCLTLFPASIINLGPQILHQYILRLTCASLLPYHLTSLLIFQFVSMMPSVIHVLFATLIIMSLCKVYVSSKTKLAIDGRFTCVKLSNTGPRIDCTTQTKFITLLFRVHVYMYMYFDINDWWLP